MTKAEMRKRGEGFITGQFHEQIITEDETGYKSYRATSDKPGKRATQIPRPENRNWVRKTPLL
ncbi:hypothetical protein ACFLS1_00735 [Verrucomicrobiota bacterium]